MNSLNKLEQLFSEFPGIGPRQAKRFVYYLLTRSGATLEEFSKLVLSLKQEISLCKSCFRYFPKDAAISPECAVCRDKNRDTSSLMIVSRDVDFENIEKTHSFSGKYFILGGGVPILEKEPDKRIRSRELLQEVAKRAKESGLIEIILALNLNPEGENTASYVRKILEPLSTQFSLKISTLGRGLSTGTELEYSDSDTIKNALKNRQ